MNSSTSDSDINPSTEDEFNGYAYYSVGLSLGVLLVITIITLVSYYCSRRNRQHDPESPQGSSAMERDTVLSIQVGLEEAALNSYPVLLYSKAKLHKADSATYCCSICLADYKDSDPLRLLPDCGHLFHRNCIDPWLRLNSSCPVCRNSPLPTPLSTPLAEVAPLAARRD